MENKHFGYLTVVLDTGRRKKSGEKIWLCKCTCTHLKEVPENSLKEGSVISCGCIHRRTGKWFPTEKFFKMSDEYRQWRAELAKFRSEDKPVPREYESYVDYLRMKWRENNG